MLLLPKLSNNPLSAEAQLLHLVTTTTALAARRPNAEEPVQQRSSGDVEKHVHPHEAEVPPPLGPEDVAAVEVLVGDAEGAVAAVSGSFWILERPGGEGQVGGQVLLASLAEVGGAEDGDFGGGAFDAAAVQHCGGDASDPVGERGDAVHEDPKAGEGVGGLHDAAEDEGHGEEEGDDCGGGLGVGEGGDDELAKGAGVDHEDDHEEEDEALAFGALDAYDGVVEGLGESVSGGLGTRRFW